MDLTRLLPGAYGAHTSETLRGLGLSDEEIEELAERKVI